MRQTQPDSHRICVFRVPAHTYIQTQTNTRIGIHKQSRWRAEAMPCNQRYRIISKASIDNTSAAKRDREQKKPKRRKA